MIRKLIRWFFANTLLPIFTPVLFLCIVEWFQDNSFSFWSTFLQLIWDGFYIFSALALIFSLIEDFPSFKMVGIGTGYGAMLMLLVILTLYIFYLIHTKDSQYVQGHSLQFGVIWLFSAVSAFSAKYKIIKYKTNNKVQ